MARICIVSKQEVPPGSGTPIREDAIIRAIRKIKERLGILQNNELVVSDEHLEEYKKKRSKFEKMAVIHVTVAAILIALLTFGPLLFGAPFNVMSILFALILGIMIAGLALLSYVPAIENGEAPSKPRTTNQIVKKLAPKKAAAPAPKRSKAKKK